LFTLFGVVNCACAIVPGVQETSILRLWSGTRHHNLGARNVLVFAIGRPIAAEIAAFGKTIVGLVNPEDERSQSVVTLSLFRVAGLTGTLTLIVLSLPGQIEHVIAYCATAVFLGLGYSTARARIVVVLFLALLAAALELAQHWIPGRHSQLIDFVASSVGAGLGIVALAIKNRWYLLPQRPWFTPL
jgi:hypothetical protein